MVTDATIRASDEQSERRRARQATSRRLGPPCGSVVRSAVQGREGRGRVASCRVIERQGNQQRLDALFGKSTEAKAGIRTR